MGSRIPARMSDRHFLVLNFPVLEGRVHRFSEFIRLSPHSPVQKWQRFGYMDIEVNVPVPITTISPLRDSLATNVRHE